MGLFLLRLPAMAAPVGTVTVSVTPGPSAHTFVSPDALGSGVDGLEHGDVAQVYTPANLKAMRGAGFGALTYRLRTELGVEAWHWNPRGRWSDAAHRQGYWTSDEDGPAIETDYGYGLPRRGDTVDQAENKGYSRLDDGDPHTFWKSNPYLDRHFTGEDNSRHPQWVVVDLGRPRPVDTVHIAWAAPYATKYHIEYWRGTNDGDPDSISDTFGDGQWQAFEAGDRDNGTGGSVTLLVARKPVRTRYVRILMTESSDGPPPGATDARDGLGYAINELSVGRATGEGHWHDWVRHGKSRQTQTTVFTSSTDPWHGAGDEDPNVEQPGFDRVFGSGLTHGLPMLAPVGVLYDTPDNAAAEVRFWRRRGYPVRQIEMGEEPDGQDASPEDYGALYIQFADALHKVDPSLQLGGPGFQTDLEGWRTWPDAHGDRSWMRRFLRYLKARGHLADFTFCSFEWYPFDNVCAPTAPQLSEAPSLLARAIPRLRREGLPPTVPLYITEYGYSSFAGQAEVDMAGALLNADFVGQFLTLGGARAYLYGLEPNTPIRESDVCDTWGNLALFLSDDQRHIRCPLAAFYGARLLTQQWAQPGGTRRPQAVFPASCDLRPLVTSYAVHRPDGQWALMLINKDPRRGHSVRIRFRNTANTRAASSWRGPVDVYQYSSAQYVWHPDKEHGHPSRDLPPAHSRLPAGPLRLPPYSLTVVRGRVAGS